MIQPWWPGSYIRRSNSSRARYANGGSNPGMGRYVTMNEFLNKKEFSLRVAEAFTDVCYMGV